MNLFRKTASVGVIRKMISVSTIGAATVLMGAGALTVVAQPANALTWKTVPLTPTETVRGLSQIYFTMPPKSEEWYVSWVPYSEEQSCAATTENTGLDAISGSIWLISNTKRIPTPYPVGSFPAGTSEMNQTSESGAWTYKFALPGQHFVVELSVNCAMQVRFFVYQH